MVSTDGLEFVDKKDLLLMRIESQIVQPVAQLSYSSPVTITPSQCTLRPPSALRYWQILCLSVKVTTI